jgi:peptidoglycan/LPS O-acetylase OafA/YrhL
MTDPPERSMAPADSSRVVALDALRGIAAMSVVLAHVTATNQIVFHPGSVTGWPNWLTRLTPLQLLWDGPIAVVIFFVLSGYVLTLPFLRRAHRGPEAVARWVSFYPKRLVRLYLPAWGALALALALALLSRGRAIDGVSNWLYHELPSGSIGRTAKDALLVVGVSNLDAPLWTLALELIASMLLPLFVLLAAAARVPLWLRAGVLMVVITAAGIVANRSIALLATFGLGALLAATSLEESSPIRSLRPRTWILLILASLLMMNAAAPLGLIHLGHHVGSGLAKLLPAVGSVGVVAAVVFWPGLAKALSIKPLEWLGTRSFSLYLTHFPLVIALAFFVPPRNLLLYSVVAVGCSLLLAEIFARIIEQPSHRLSKAVGRNVYRRALSWAEQR